MEMGNSSSLCFSLEWHQCAAGSSHGFHCHDPVWNTQVEGGGGMLSPRFTGVKAV